MPLQAVGLLRCAAWMLAAAVAAVSLTPEAGAQRLILGNDPMGREGSGDPAQGVYVRDSAIASDKFELGKRMERLKEWHKSADVYQEILRMYKDRVVPTDNDGTKAPTRYASVRQAVIDRLARWPEEGLIVYRNRFEPEAAGLLESAKRGDAGKLHEVFDLYFPSDSAKAAGTRLIDFYLEAGEFATAGDIGRRLLEWHPNLAVERPQVLYRTISAYHLAGNKTAAENYFGELRTNHPNEIAVISGKDTPLVEALARQLEEPPPAMTGVASDSYPTFHGSASRADVPKAPAVAGAMVYATKLPGPPTAGMPESSRRALEGLWENANRTGAGVNIIPAVDRGQLFFHDGYRLYALHLESGVPLSGWGQTYGGQRQGQYHLPVQMQMFGGQGLDQQLYSAPRQHTLTLTEDAVLAVMGFADPRLMAMGGQALAGAGTRLVCLERATGRQRWTADPNNLPNNAGNARNLSFSGSPLVVGDNVYVIARGGANAGVEDCHVFCYGLESGGFKWACYIASSQVNAVNMNGMPAMPSGGTMSHLAFAGGRVFVCTNLGAVAAVDAYSGATSWLVIYPRTQNALRMRGAGGGGGFFGGGMIAVGNDPSAGKPWEFNPVIASDGKIFVVPSDGQFVHVYDQTTGEEIKRISRDLTRAAIKHEDRYSVTMLLGVMGEKIILGGRGMDVPGHGQVSNDMVFCFNWRTYAPPEDKPQAIDENAVVWLSPFAAIRGRPFLTQETLFIPDEKAMRILQLKTGMVTKSYPTRGGEWPEGEGPGNIVVTADHVIVAGAKQVGVYTDLQGVRDRYAAAIEADPNAVEPRLVFAELMFNAREAEEARKVLDEAIRVLGGVNNMQPGPHRDRIFSDAILFAQRLGAEKNSVTSLKIAESLFDLASAAALSPSQQVHYRITRARFIDSLKDVQKPDYAKAVRLYQEILLDPAMRTIPLTGEDPTGAVQAGKLAETAITDLIRKNTPLIYQEFERDAAVALEKVAADAAADGKPAAMLAVAENYPNSSVAQRAMMLAAGSFEKAGEARMATQVLRRLYFKYNPRFTNADRARLIEAMARNYLKVGNAGAALGRLQKAVSLADSPLESALVGADGGALKLPDGGEVKTFKDAVAALSAAAMKRSEATLPDVNMPRRRGPMTVDEILARGREKPKPLPPPFDAPAPVIANVAALVKPPVEMAALVRNDRALAWMNGKLACFEAGAAEPMWSSNALGELPQGAAWLEKYVLVWGGGEAALLDAQTGASVWKADLRQLPAVDMVPTGDAEVPAEVPAAVAVPEQQVQGRVLVEELRARRMLELVPPPVPQPGVPGGAPGAAMVDPAIVVDGRERVAHVRPLTDRVILSTTTGRVAALELASGNPIWQTRLASQGIIQTLATDDFVALRLMGQNQSSQIIVLDAFNGQQLWSRVANQQGANAPINAALADDGTLVWTTANQILAKDLYEPGESASWERAEGKNYAGFVRPDQLVISGQRVLAVCEQGRLIDQRNLRTGQREGPSRDGLPTGAPGNSAADFTVRLRLAGPRMYAIGARSYQAFHLEHETGASTVHDSLITNLQDEALLTQDFVVLPGVVTTEQKKEESDRYVLMAISRELIPEGKSGKQKESVLKVHRYEMTEPAGIKSFLAVKGGIYFLGNDERLQFLKGNRPAK